MRLHQTSIFIQLTAVFPISFNLNVFRMKLLLVVSILVFINQSFQELPPQYEEKEDEMENLFETKHASSRVTGEISGKSE